MDVAGLTAAQRRALVALGPVERPTCLAGVVAFVAAAAPALRGHVSHLVQL
jgi:hypothetical protein